MADNDNLYSKKSIGVFDSGFGGIDVLRGIIKELPEYDFVYFGDSARAPYGNRSRDEVYEFTKQAVDFLFSNDCELIIFACNTASSEALRKIQQEYLPKKYPHKRVLGVLIPAVEEAFVKSKTKRIGVIATEGTVQSNAYIREFAIADPHIKVFQYGCPLLVPLVEAGKHNELSTYKILENYLTPLKKKHVDTLILGCTHYGILEKHIRAIMGNGVSLISSSKVVPKKLKLYLTHHPEIENELGKNGRVQFFTSGQVEKFVSLGTKFFGKKITAQYCSLN